MKTAGQLPKVLITNSVPPSVLAPLSGLAEVIQGPADGSLRRREDVLASAPALVGIINQGELQVNKQLLDQAPKLRIVASVSMGFNHMDVALMAARGIWATNVPDAFVESTADCTMSLLLGLARKLPQADRYVRSGQWPDDGFQPGVWDGMLLAGKTLGIVGYGRIGQAVARRARAFGMNIRFNSRQPSDNPEYQPLDALLRESDIVSLHIPLTNETHHLLDVYRLGLMKQGVILINMARGAVVEESALVAALQNGNLAGAGLDVFEHEPNVHPTLLKMDDVILTPHIGGGTVESRQAARQLCAQNVALVLQGKRPLTPVNEPQLDNNLIGE